DHFVDRFDRLELRVGKDIVIEVAGFDVPRRQDQVRGLHRLHDVEDRESPRLKSRGIQADIDLADLAAFDGRRRHIRQLLELRGDRVKGQIVETAFVQIRARHGHERHGDVRHVELDDERLLDAGRQLVQNLSDALHHLHLTDVDVRVPVEPDLDGADALLGERLDVLDVRRGAYRFFDGLDDALLDVVGLRTLMDDAANG